MTAAYKRRIDIIVRFTMYFRSKFLESSKPIHFWNPYSIRFPKNNVGICADTTMAAILDLKNGRHKNTCFAISRLLSNLET